MSRSRASVDSCSASSSELKVPFLGPGNHYPSVQVHERRLRRFKWSLAVSWAIIVVLTCVIIFLTLKIPKYEHYWIEDELYSPAQEVVEYKTVTFTAGIGHTRTKYQGPPSDDINKAWEDLYQAGVSIIPEEQAAKLLIPGWPILEAPGQYVIQLDVFHELHCLNSIRLGLWGRDNALLDRNSTPNFNETGFSMEHLEHCIDAIRQSLMCNADISPVTWVWNSRAEKARPIENSTHTCRDFDAIRKWAKDRWAPVWNDSINVPELLRNR